MVRTGEPRLRTPAAAAAAAAVFGLACAGPERGVVERGVVERDSAGVHVVENPAEALQRTLTVSSEPVWSVGAVGGLLEQQLYQVTAAIRLDDGTVVVANAGTRELRFYGPDGAHRASAGGEGEGPSEFRYPVGITVLHDGTVQVQDVLDRVRFTPSGEFVERLTTDRGRLQEMAGPGGDPEGGLWLSDGSLFTPIYQRDGDGPPKAGPPFRPPMTFVRLAPASGLMDTLGTFGGTRQQYVESAPGRVSPATQPFAVTTAWARGADGTLLVADSERPEVHVFRGEGAHVVVRWAAEREPLTTDELEAWKERRRGEAWAKARLPMLERAWAAMDMPTHKAAYGREVALGRDGSLWVPESSDLFPDPATFLVFTPEGRLRGRATLPGPFRVTDAGADWVLGVWLDENQVEFVRMYTVGGPA